MMIRGIILSLKGLKVGKFISSNELWDCVCESLGYPNSPRGKQNIKIEKDYGFMHIDHYSTGFGIRYTSISGIFNDDMIVENTNSKESNFLCFNVGNSVFMEDVIKAKRVQWNTGVCLGGEQYEGHISNSLYAKKQKIHLHCIGFDKTVFEETIQDNEFAEQESFYKGEYIDVNRNQLINIAQKKILNDLFQMAHLSDEKLKELYLESKLLELVYISLNTKEFLKESEEIFLSQKDIASLSKAKKILTENMINPPSLKQLAYKSAINEFKLKKGFKQIFGTTVYGMLHEYRLDYARKLLTNKDISIQEAAKIVGYSSCSHFSKIFKERFGINPMMLKKQTR